MQKGLNKMKGEAECWDEERVLPYGRGAWQSQLGQEMP